MRKKLKVTCFKASEAPIKELKSKLGGQPVWLDAPEWPLSRKLNIQMSFIGQIAIDEKLFPNSKAKMAYLFMTDDDVDGTWLPDGGENAIILQPAENDIRTVCKEKGPTLQNYVKREGFERLQPIDVEYLIQTEESSDPDFLPEDTLWDMEDSIAEEYSKQTEGNKIGGTPGFLQGDEFPDESNNWDLLLQLDSCSDQFSINFGDAGISYSFINNEGTKAKFLWQCC